MALPRQYTANVSFHLYFAMQSKSLNARFLYIAALCVLLDTPKKAKETCVIQYVVKKSKGTWGCTVGDGPNSWGIPWYGGGDGPKQLGYGGDIIVQTSIRHVFAQFYIQCVATFASILIEFQCSKRIGMKLYSWGRSKQLGNAGGDGPKQLGYSVGIV